MKNSEAEKLIKKLQQMYIKNTKNIKNTNLYAQGVRLGYENAVEDITELIEKMIEP